MIRNLIIGGMAQTRNSNVKMVKIVLVASENRFALSHPMTPLISTGGGKLGDGSRRTKDKAAIPRDRWSTCAIIAPYRSISAKRALYQLRSNEVKRLMVR